MATYDQENVDACKDVLKTRDGINHLALYHSSVGRLFLILSRQSLTTYGCFLNCLTKHGTIDIHK